ncbi:unnamed protein product [Rhodiola kirilowii]
MVSFLSCCPTVTLSLSRQKKRSSTLRTIRLISRHHFWIIWGSVKCLLDINCIEGYVMRIREDRAHRGVKRGKGPSPSRGQARQRTEYTAG